MKKEEYEDKLQELSNKFWRINMNSIATKYNELCSDENITEDGHKMLDSYKCMIDRWNNEVYNLFILYSELKKEGMQNIADPSKYLLNPDR